MLSRHFHYYYQIRNLLGGANYVDQQATLAVNLMVMSQMQM